MATRLAERIVAKTPTVTVRIAAAIAEEARVVAAMQGRDMVDLLNEIVGPAVHKLWVQEIGKAARKAEKGRKGGEKAQPDDDGGGGF